MKCPSKISCLGNIAKIVSASVFYSLTGLAKNTFIFTLNL